jgi:hypothetical protein
VFNFDNILIIVGRVNEVGYGGGGGSKSADPAKYGLLMQLVSQIPDGVAEGAIGTLYIYMYMYIDTCLNLGANFFCSE